MNNVEHLKPGDQVISGSRNHDQLSTVERVTKTQVILPDGSRYRRLDGGLVGGNAWNFSYIRDATDEDRARILYREAVAEVERIMSTRQVRETDRYKSDTYKARLVAAKRIIDAALGTQEES